MGKHQDSIHAWTGKWIKKYRKLNKEKYPLTGSDTVHAIKKLRYENINCIPNWYTKPTTKRKRNHSPSSSSSSDEGEESFAFNNLAQGASFYWVLISILYCAYDPALPMHAEQMSQQKTDTELEHMGDEDEGMDNEEEDREEAGRYLCRSAEFFNLL